MIIVPFLVPDMFKYLIIRIQCGEKGIRTPGTLLEYTRFPSVPLKPLEHLSFFRDTKVKQKTEILKQKIRLQKEFLHLAWFVRLFLVTSNYIPLPIY